MWGGATRVPEPEELEGLTGIKFPLNSAPMGATPLGFLMRRNKKGRGRDGLFPINTYHRLHTSFIYSLLLSCLSPETPLLLLGVMGPLPNTTIAPISIAGSSSVILTLPPGKLWSG